MCIQVTRLEYATKKIKDINWTRIDIWGDNTESLLLRMKCLKFGVFFIGNWILCKKKHLFLLNFVWDLCFYLKNTRMLVFYISGFV